jgi:GT2 family glycosyltransferase
LQVRQMISIVIPVCGQVALTRRCVASIRAHTVGEYEIILVSNGSTPGEVRLLHEMTNCELGIRNDVLVHYPRMLGYPAAVNVGAKEARGEYLCLMNNDAAFTGPWDRRLIEALGYGEVVSPIVDNIGQPCQRLGDRWAPGHLSEVGMLFFVCVVMRRTLFQDLGGLDEAYGLGNGEDVAFCREVLACGGRLLVEPAVYVTHQGSATFLATLGAEGYAELLETNRRLRHE